jgi:hypothetical protein
VSSNSSIASVVWNVARPDARQSRIKSPAANPADDATLTIVSLALVVVVV